jgi:hypothetical protein
MDLSRDVMLYPEGWWRDTGADWAEVCLHWVR